MAAVSNPVGDLSNLLQKTHLEKPAEEKTPTPEAVVKSSAFKSHVCSARLIEGAVRCEYALGTIEIVREVAILKFKTSETPFDETSNFLDGTELPTVKDFKHENVVSANYNYPVSPDAQQVTTVIVNIDCTYPPRLNSTIGSIGNLCREAFMHMKPEYSSANVHYGAQHWTADSIFLPNNFIVLRNKWPASLIP